MTRIFLITLLLASKFLFSQNPNKTFADTVFTVGDIITIPYIHYDSYCRGCPEDGISYRTKDSLKSIANFILTHPKLVLQITVHTDHRGDAKKNLIFSQQRAESIRDYLIKEYLIDKENLKAKGLGESNLLFNEETINQSKTPEEKEALHSKNRRTELRVIGFK